MDAYQFVAAIKKSPFWGLKVGMPARIRSLAFKSEVFEGQVKAISTQAINHADTGLPSFVALVVVSALTPEEQALLRIGMSATIELDVASEHKLLVPMIALKQNRSQNLLQVIDPNGQIKDIPVVTGMIFEDQVVIDSGLKAGDTVVYSYASS